MGWLALALAGCASSESPPTQLVVSINSDLDVGEELASVVVYVLDPDSAMIVSQHSFELTDREPGRGEVRLPFSFGLSKGKKDRFRLDVVGYGPTGEDGAEEAVVEQKVLGEFRDEQTLLLKVFLSRVCFLKLCEDDGQTCHPDSGDCGDLLEPSLTRTRAGEERNAWPDEPSGMAGRDGGSSGAGESGRGGSGSAGRAGDAGGAGRDGGAEPAAGTGGEAGEGAAGETGEAGEGSAGAGSGGEGGASAGSGGSAGSSAGSGGAGTGGSGGTTAGCVPTGETFHDSEGAEHVATGVTMTLPSDYDSDPPSSGMHCNNWGIYTTFTPAKPLPLCNWVHNLEHGSVVLLYNCPEGCPQIVAGLEQVIADSPPDPNCATLEPPIKRLVLTPYNGMSAKFAATTWQYTWTSNCDTFTAADREALLGFIDAHWGSPKSLAGEKGTCNQGQISPTP